MEIEALKGKRVKICPRSITCKDDNDKTCGVVTNVVSFLNLAPRYQCELSRKFNRQNLDWKQIYVRNNKELFYLLNLRKIEFYERYIKGKEGFADEENKYDKMIACAKEAEKTMMVIPCYIVG